MKVGDKVRIKDKDTIRSILNKDKESPCGIYTPDNMLRHCGSTVTISEIKKTNGAIVEENSWIWDIAFLEPLVDVDRYNRSLCLALCRQVLSGNAPSLRILLREGTSFPGKGHGGFYYADYPDNWDGYKAYNIPDWDCLKVDPGILEKALKYALKDGKKITEDLLKGSLSGWFMWYDTSEKQEFWAKIKQQITNKDTPSSTDKQKSHEIKLQGEEYSVLRGDIPEGHKLCSGKSKAAIVSRPVEYKVCFGG